MKLPPFKSPIVLGKKSIPVAVAQLVTASQTSGITRAVLEAELPDWKCKNITGADGITRHLKVMPLVTVPNIKAIARLYGWTIRYNEMSKRVELTRPGTVVPHDDVDNTSLTLLGDDVVRCGLNRDALPALVDAAASTDRYHPVRDWIEATAWDGITRLDLFHGTLELADARKKGLAAKLLDAFMLQGIGAMLEANGIAAQGLLVLAGPQDVRKTSWVKGLVPLPEAVGSGFTLDPDSKDSVLRVIRYLISELGELDATTRRSDVAALKAFITASDDVIRLPYGKRDTSYKRRTIFVGTVNETGFLVDPTGNRRFWVIEVLRCHTLSAADMQQVWAEYLCMYRNGARWHLDADTKAALNQSNLAHTAVDPLKELIARRWDWEGVDWNVVDASQRHTQPQVQWLTATEICQRAGIERPTRSDTTRTGAIVKDLRRVSPHGTGDRLERMSNGSKLLAIPVRVVLV